VLSNGCNGCVCVCVCVATAEADEQRHKRSTAEIEICCTAHTNARVRHLVKSVIRGLKACQVGVCMCGMCVARVCVCARVYVCCESQVLELDFRMCVKVCW
jgi:hypothetical protein